MLKGSTKITALMVAATSIISMIPAVAADVKKIEAQEGTVYYGKAKGNGTFIIDGKINSKDEDAVYYVADGKYNELKNAASGDTISGDIFEKKYIEFDDGDYYIDLTNGDKTDDSIADNWHDDIASTVRKNLKNDNDGRLKDSAFDAIVNANPQLTNSNKPFMNGAMGNWSEFKYDLKTNNLNGVSKATIYSDPDGKYIDTDYNLGNFGVVTKTTSDAVVIKNTEDTYEITDGSITYELKAQIASAMALSEGYDYILRSANISIWGRDKALGGAYANMTDQFNFGSKSNAHAVPLSGSGTTTSVSVFQKLSKAQSSDDIDGIKYAKDASTYFKTDSDAKAQTLYQAMSTNSAGIVNFKTVGTKYYAQEVKLKAENGFYYTDLGDSDDVDINASSIGGGMLYCLSDGYVKVWNNVDAFEKLYKVDGSMNKISASNKDNIIVWNEDDEVYSIIANKAATTNTTTTATTTGVTTTSTQVTAANWVKANDSTWSYNKADGTKATGWFQDATGTWYFAKAEGTMVANGWAQSGSAWYYLGATGAMVTNQWGKSGNDWYYLSSTGVMLTNTVQDGYKISASGAWVN